MFVIEQANSVDIYPKKDMLECKKLDAQYKHNGKLTPLKCFSKFITIQLRKRVTARAISVLSKKQAHFVTRLSDRCINGFIASFTSINIKTFIKLISLVFIVVIRKFFYGY